MNAQKAKAIKKEIYGDMSPRVRTYDTTPLTITLMMKDTKGRVQHDRDGKIMVKTLTRELRVADGLRREYKRVKKRGVL